MNVAFRLNGIDVSIVADPMERLSDILRDRYAMASLMNDCGIGMCGKCVVFLDGHAVPSCLVPAFRVRGRSVVTYEGFAGTAAHEKVKRAFSELDAELCGFCDAATYMAAGALINAAVKPSEEEITETMSSVYCRCASPSLVLAAAKKALEPKSPAGRNRAPR